MSTRNKARKSTGSPSSTSSNNANTNRRRSANLNNSTRNSSVRTRSSSSSDHDAPTQPLNSRNRNSHNDQSQPGPSSTSSRTLNSRLLSSDAESDDSTQNLQTVRKKFTRIQRSQSSNDTTSDSDQAGRHDKSTNNRNHVKSRKLNSKSSAVSKKKFTKTKNKDTASEEEYEPSKKGASVNHAAAFSKQNISSLVNKCVYYLIVADQKKYSIKRQDILKNVFCAQNRLLYSEVMKEAGQLLKKIYGMELLSHEQKKGEYLMINILNHDLRIQELAEYTPSELQKRGLIFYLLTVIFMNDKSITEDDLGTALKPLGIDINSKTPHPVFGEVKKYLTSELVKQMYLEYKCICKDPPHYEFSWGVRAHQEFDKKDLLKFACEITTDTKPSDWILQYQDAIKSARQPDE